jgi:two-component system, LytTR family, response regulator
MLRCIAIDDEELALELLEDNIRKVPFLELVATCSHPLQAMKVMQTEHIDLVFLDIQMPGLTGLQFIQSNIAQQCMYILITAYDKYALEGFNLDVVDYLLKPVELHRFIKACNKALELHKLRKNKSPDADVAASQDFLFVNVEYSLVKVLKSDILWIEGLKDYVKIHLKSSPNPVVTRLSIKGIEDELPAAQFMRIHKSYIVSLAAISSVRKSSVFLGNIELPMSDNYREAFYKWLGKGG